MNSKKILSSIITMGILAFAPATVLASESKLNPNIASGGSTVVETDDSFVSITKENENIVQMNAPYDETTGLSYDEILKLYNQYLTSQTYTISKESYLSTKTLNEFAQYAVDNGIIKDTPIQRGAITKAVVRAEFKVVVSGGKTAGYTTAAALLEHSLQDSPSNLSLSSGSTYSTQILKSSECKKIISDFKTAVKGKNLSGRATSGSTTLNSTTDLHLAYNKVSYTASGRNTNGKWTLTITFKDTYDFESQAWKNAMTDNLAVTALNNYAAYAQSIGAIVPYNVQVIVKTTFTE